MRHVAFVSALLVALAVQARADMMEDQVGAPGQVGTYRLIWGDASSYSTARVSSHVALAPWAFGNDWWMFDASGAADSDGFGAEASLEVELNGYVVADELGTDFDENLTDLRACGHSGTGVAVNGRLVLIAVDLTLDALVDLEGHARQRDRANPKGLATLKGRIEAEVVGSVFVFYGPATVHEADLRFYDGTLNSDLRADAVDATGFSRITIEPAVFVLKLSGGDGRIETVVNTNALGVNKYLFRKRRILPVIRPGLFPYQR
ncbi:MAG: hypothetical protein ACYS0K_01430 [Planctomycetota bacterium]|jgi:hypothetical protein